MVPFWKEALEMVLDVEPGKLNQVSHVSSEMDGKADKGAEEDSSKIPDVSIIESSAELLYGVVHQRFILTKAGLASMVSCPMHCSIDLRCKRRTS